MIGIDDGFMKNIKNIIIITGIGWIAHSVSDSNTQIAVISSKLETIQMTMDKNEASFKSQIAEAKGNSADRYTSYDAEKDFRTRDGMINHNSAEIEAIQKRLSDVEMHIYKGGK